MPKRAKLEQTWELEALKPPKHTTKPRESGALSCEERSAILSELLLDLLPEADASTSKEFKHSLLDSMIIMSILQVQ